jgi:hypothetical protein
MKCNVKFYKTDGTSWTIPRFAMGDDCLDTPEKRAASFERLYQLAVQAYEKSEQRKAKQSEQWPPADTVPLAIRE